MRAPAIIVELLLTTDADKVDPRSLVRLVMSSSSMRRNGRYLLSERAIPFCFGPFSLSRCSGVEGPSRSPFSCRSVAKVGCDPRGGSCAGDVG